MADSVPQEIAVRVTAAADAVAVGREHAQLAARDATSYLAGITPTSVDDAYRRYTASNNPAYLAMIPADSPRSRGCGPASWSRRRHADHNGGAITSPPSEHWLSCPRRGRHGRPARLETPQHRTRLRELEDARAAANPWPFQAERTPAYNPDAEPGATRVETRLLGLTVLLTEEIRRSPAWNNPILDQHRVRINLDATLQDVSHRAYRVWRMRTDTPPPSGESTVSAALAQQVDEYIRRGPHGRERPARARGGARRIPRRVAPRRTPAARPAAAGPHQHQRASRAAGPAVPGRGGQRGRRADGSRNTPTSCAIYRPAWTRSSTSSANRWRATNLLR